MDNSELVAAVSFVIDRLLFHRFSPESLTNGLRRGVDVIGSFVAAIDKEFDFEPWGISAIHRRGDGRGGSGR